MKNNLFLLFFNVGFLLFTTSTIKAQTITPKPIYEGAQNLTIKEFDTGAIAFLYQDADYSAIVAIESFYVNSKSEAISLIQKAIDILSMQETDKNQDIEDRIGALKLVRYGFSQYKIHIFNRKMKQLSLTKEELEKIKEALQKYSYKSEINKK